MMEKKLHTREFGQTLLIILLVMAVVLTVVLSTVSRSVSDVKLTGIEENALRAFSAAEAGVEQSLLDFSLGNSGPIPVDSSDPSVTYERLVTEPVVGSEFEYPKELVSGETATFWLVSHLASGGALTCGGGVPCFSGNSSTQFRVCWDNLTGTENPALEVMVYYDTTRQAVASPNNFSGVQVARLAYDKFALSRGNGFSTQVNNGLCQIGSRNYLYRSDLVIPNNPVFTACKSVGGCMLMVKVRSYYNTKPIPVGIVSTVNLPAQGFRIESTGVASSNTGDEATRKVSVFQSYPEIPDAFDAAVFSLKDLVK